VHSDNVFIKRKYNFNIHGLTSRPTLPIGIWKWNLALWHSTLFETQDKTANFPYFSSGVIVGGNGKAYTHFFLIPDVDVKLTFFDRNTNIGKWHWQKGVQLNCDSQ
jgi:hypothetical protein